jgi:hypothetical protein
MNANTMYLDNYLDYNIVVESATEPNTGFQLLDEKKSPNGDLSYLKFRACLQTFTGRNRNRRLWVTRWTRPMFEAPEIKELLQHGGVPGEAGHPVPPTGEVTIERILTIDPNNISHVIKEYIWPSDTRVDGIIETIDDGNGPGDKFKRHILQGLPVSFSTRSVIPQRKNPDGTIDQTGPGRYVTSDRVFLPSHKEAYIDKSIPVKNICKPNHFETVMESYVSFVTEKSDKMNRILDGMDVAMESASMDKNGMITVPTSEGIVCAYPELKYRREFADIMKNL